MEIQWLLIFAMVLEANAAPRMQDTRLISSKVDDAAPDCEKRCFDEKEDFICGTDDLTHRNECKLLIAACQNPEKKIRKAYSGKCGSIKEQTRDIYHTYHNGEDTDHSHISGIENIANMTTDNKGTDDSDGTDNAEGVHDVDGRGDADGRGEDVDESIYQTGHILLLEERSDSCIYGETIEQEGKICCCNAEGKFDCNSTCEDSNLTMDGMNYTMDGMNYTTDGMNYTMDGMNSTIDGMDTTMIEDETTIETIMHTMETTENTPATEAPSSSTTKLNISFLSMCLLIFFSGM